MKLRIHGDNIIECERALKLISLAKSKDLSDNSDNPCIASCKYNSKESLI